METKYATLKRALKKSMHNWDNNPLSGSAKSAYLEAKQNMIDYYNEITSVHSDIEGLASVEKQT